MVLEDCNAYLRNNFSEPRSSPQTQKTTKIINLRYLFFVISSNLLTLNYMFVCFFPRKQTNKQKKSLILSPLLPLRNKFLRAFWEAVPQVEPSKRSLNKTWWATFRFCIFLQQALMNINGHIWCKRTELYIIQNETRW